METDITPLENNIPEVVNMREIEAGTVQAELVRASASQIKQLSAQEVDLRDSVAVVRGGESSWDEPDSRQYRDPRSYRAGLMPSVSEKQARFMRAVAHGWKPTRGEAPPVEVAKEFVAADKHKKNLANALHKRKRHA